MTGIYGVMAYHVNQRRRETAIRRALGAQASRVVGGVVLTGLRLVGTGISIGMIGALLMSHSLATLLFRVEPRDPVSLVTVAALLADGRARRVRGSGRANRAHRSRVGAPGRVASTTNTTPHIVASAGPFFSPNT